MEYACSIFKIIDDPSSFEYNAIIRGYVKDMNSKEALFTFLEMLEKGVDPDNFTYPILLKAITQLSAIGEGTQIHGQILKKGFVEDVLVQNSLINMYGRCGKIRHSCVAFEQMAKKSIASWSALIGSHANLGMWDECLRLFREMNNDNAWRAEESILVSVLSSCTHLGALDLGRCTHGYLLRNLSGFNVAVETSLIDMYIKCGSIDKGLSLFRKMRLKNEMSYSVIISGLAHHGRGKEALETFEKMLEEGLKPDDIIYVGVLNACSHDGLVEEGLKYFKKMREHGIVPAIQHYGCIVDLMGRAGMVDRAFETIKSMPMKPNDIIWRSLLTSCKIHQNVEIAEVAAKSLLHTHSQNASDFLMMSNVYAQAKRWEDVSYIRTQMARLRVPQVPGSSLVEVRRKVYKFVSSDQSHPNSQDIYEMLHQMEWQLRFEGYFPDTSQIFLDVDEEEKRQRLNTHSQKLAIAFSLIHTSQGDRIRIVRNVRMCSDCHGYTKLISRIYEREIIVRDRNRFHHFRDGACSCRDYW
ncbi:pentatricopeptide repeat-containing protein-like [Dorcoceras hygrometricum]|uniref:Pentatricopeptide repeat-containing protein-like n=1 Tax=Dorcoceras hygrometricum TaxID=472368 RepID=A0A2Z7CHC7_9LAMI|nr:pentatricopeptide repeat-containing protein-like [Dorcoceras hygrometricum]